LVDAHTETQRTELVERTIAPDAQGGAVVVEV
jgi:hypothetical protein